MAACTVAHVGSCVFDWPRCDAMMQMRWVLFGLITVVLTHEMQRKTASRPLFWAKLALPRSDTWLLPVLVCCIHGLGRLEKVEEGTHGTRCNIGQEGASRRCEG